MKKPVCYICYPNFVPKYYRPSRHYRSFGHLKKYSELSTADRVKFDEWKNRIFPDVTSTFKSGNMFQSTSRKNNKKIAEKTSESNDLLFLNDERDANKSNASDNVNNERNTNESDVSVNISDEENTNETDSSVNLSDEDSIDSEYGEIEKSWFYEDINEYDNEIHNSENATIGMGNSDDGIPLDNKYVPERKSLHGYEPFMTEVDALLFILLEGPKNNFSDTERERILYYIKRIIKIKPSQTPSLSTLKSYHTKIQTPRLVERKYNTRHGKERYYSLDLKDIFSMYCSIPGALNDLKLTSENSNNSLDKTTLMKSSEILREEYQPLRIKSNLHTFNLFDEVTIKLNGESTNCILTGVRENGNEKGLRLKYSENEIWINENKIEILKHLSNINDNNNKVFTKDNKEYSFYISMYNDATAGSTTKKWSAHEIFAITILNQDKCSFPFLKNIILSIVRCLDGNPVYDFCKDFVDDLKKFEQGIYIFDLNAMSWIKYRVLLMYIKGDNAAVDALLGNRRSPLNCRLCNYKKEYGGLGFPEMTQIGSLKTKSSVLSDYTELNEIFNSQSHSDTVKKKLSHEWSSKTGLNTNPSPFLSLSYFDPFLQSPIEVLHTLYLGLYKYLTIHLLSSEFEKARKNQTGNENYYGTFLQLPNKSLAETLTAKVNGFNWCQDTNRLSGYDITKRFRSFNGKDYRTFVSIAIFILTGLVRPQSLEIFRTLANFNTFLHKVPVSNIESWSEQYDKLYMKLITLVNQWDENLLKNKTKIHLLRHMPYYIFKFGHFSEYSTEYFESKNKDVRQMIYHSAHTQHSKSSMLRISRSIGLTHLFSGGWQRRENMTSKSTIFVQASKHLLDIAKDPIIAECLDLKYSKEITEVQYVYNVHLISDLSFINID